MRCWSAMSSYFLNLRDTLQRCFASETSAHCQPVPEGWAGIHLPGAIHLEELRVIRLAEGDFHIHGQVIYVVENYGSYFLLILIQNYN